MSPAAETPLSEGLAVAVTRVAQTTVTEQVPVAQPADQQVEDANLDEGSSNVTQEGSAGTDPVTYQVTTTNGAETAKTEVSRTAVTPAQPKIIAVGTKPVSTPPSSRFIHGFLQPVPPAQFVQQPRAVQQRLRQLGGAGLLRLQRHQLGRHRLVRVDQQLVHQHR